MFHYVLWTLDLQRWHLGQIAKGLRFSERSKDRKDNLGTDGNDHAGW